MSFMMDGITKSKGKFHGPLTVRRQFRSREVSESAFEEMGKVLRELASLSRIWKVADEIVAHPRRLQC